jgi:hypothetical protein
MIAVARVLLCNYGTTCPTCSLVTFILISPPESCSSVFLFVHNIDFTRARVTIMNATQAVLDWITAHPYQTAFHIVNGVIICTPAAAAVPFLSALGYGATGPIAGMFGSSISRDGD